MEKKVSSLSVQGIYTAYDRADVLENLSLEVVEGSITCLLGNNGSGKTTLIRSILGLTPPRSGRIMFQGADITHLPTHQIIRQGLASIPEGRKVFPGLSVEENLRLGGYQEDDKEVLLARMRKVYQIFPRLEERSIQLAGTMSGGEQAMVSIGRGLMGAPKLLIIDEPSLGSLAFVGQGELPHHSGHQETEHYGFSGGTERAADISHFRLRVRTLQGQGGGPG